jgi:hypothetical protein
MPDPTLILRRAKLSRKGVVEGAGCVGRIFLDANSAWFWGVDFQITGRKSYGHVPTHEVAKAAFRAEYEVWKGT